MKLRRLYNVFYKKVEIYLRQGNTNQDLGVVTGYWALLREEIGARFGN